MNTQQPKAWNGDTNVSTFASFTMAQLNAFIAGCYARNDCFDGQFRAATLERNNRADVSC